MSSFSRLAMIAAGAFVPVSAFDGCADGSCASPALSMVQREASIMQVDHQLGQEPEGHNATGLGDPRCPCVGIGFSDGRVNVRGVEFAAGLGAQCNSWEEGVHPSCDGSATQPSWCSSSWCYVDPCNCDIGSEPIASYYFNDAEYQGKKLRYSYTTCGSENSYTPQHIRPEPVDEHPPMCDQQMDTGSCHALKWCKWSEDTSACAPKTSEDECAEHVPDEEIHGKSGCECVGIKGMVGMMKGITLAGAVNGMIDGSFKDQFPAEIGGSCHDWDSDTNRGCDSDANKPHWCYLKYCYVDPCTCNLAVPAKKSQYFPDATFQGKPLHYSYQTCNNDYEWDKNGDYTSYEDDCVQQADETACSAMADHCAWINDLCRSKELEGMCLSAELPSDEVSLKVD